MSTPLPERLESIVAMAEAMDSSERCDFIVANAESAARHAPKPGEVFDTEVVRKDPGCVDFIGMHVRVENQGGIKLAISLGKDVQALNRALASILCDGVNGASIDQVLALDEGFVRRLMGEALVRQRSKTIFVLIHRLKEAVAGLPVRSS